MKTEMSEGDDKEGITTHGLRLGEQSPSFIFSISLDINKFYDIFSTLHLLSSHPVPLLGIMSFFRP